MRIITGGRATGKTTELLREAEDHVSGIPGSGYEIVVIIVGDRQRKQTLERIIAKAFVGNQLQSIHVVTWYEYTENRNGWRERTLRDDRVKILVDDADYVMAQMFGREPASIVINAARVVVGGETRWPPRPSTPKLI